ncbi:MAG: hypothetical protein AAF296_06370 [Pseudomonadota bacterium]
MTKTIKALIAGSAMTLALGSASADNTFTADFTFSPTAPVEITYERFEDIAEQACKADASELRGVGVRMKIEDTCRAQLLEDAVKASKLRTLIAYHQQRKGEAESQTLFAELE